MRHVVSTIAYALLTPFLFAACACGTPPTMRLALPSMDVPPPVMFTATQVPPQFVPSGYQQVVQVQQAPQYQAIPTYAAPCAAPQFAAPAAPCYQPGFQYAPAPQVPAPRAAGDCR